MVAKIKTLIFFYMVLAGSWYVKKGGPLTSYTTQLYGKCNRPLKGSLSTNTVYIMECQPRVFFVAQMLPVCNFRSHSRCMEISKVRFASLFHNGDVGIALRWRRVSVTWWLMVVSNYS